MNPNLCRVVLRPRGPLEVIDLGFRLVRERMRPFAILGIIVTLPVFLPLAFATWLFDGHWAVAIAPLVVGPLMQAPFTVLTGRLMFSEDVSLTSVMRDTVAAFPVLAATWILALVGWAVSARTCFYGTPFVQAALLYLPETALLERVSAQRGLRRSFRLAGGHMGISLVGSLARWGITVWCGIVAESSGHAIVSTVLQLGSPFGSLMEGTVTPYLILGLLVAQPAFAIYRLLLYVDLRTRVEGWDLQVGLRAAGLERQR